MRILGWDIGGAHIKVSDGASVSREIEFPMWSRPGDLAGALQSLMIEHPADAWAVTMTGELADCFSTKAEGVAHIVRAVQEAAEGRETAIWSTAGEFVNPDEAIAWPLLVAAANWHALATWAGRAVPTGNALLIDIGSTTTDIIPLRNGFPDPTGRTDTERLISGELIYTGVRRTPLNTIASVVEINGERCPLAAELFASALDLYLLSGEITEDASDPETANARPATVEHALDRVARMVCADRNELTEAAIRSIAAQLGAYHVRQISAGIERIAASLGDMLETVVLSGSGEFLARRALESIEPRLKPVSVLSLSEMLGDSHSQAACAFALSRLAAERL
jgi:probable H4MPT-linked C1 transfer pathway protein